MLSSTFTKKYHSDQPINKLANDLLHTKSLHLKESAQIEDDLLVTSQGPIAFLVQATKTFLQETSNST